MSDFTDQLRAYTADPTLRYDYARAMLAAADEIERLCQQLDVAIRGADRAVEIARQRERCASAAWIQYMDVCKARGLAPSEHEHWNAARAVREA